MGRVPERCDECGAAYRAFRSGLTFGEVRIELRSEMHRERVTRHTVLGRMHEHKLIRWGEWHGVGRCVADPATPPEPTPIDGHADAWPTESDMRMTTDDADLTFPPPDDADLTFPPPEVEVPRVRKRRPAAEVVAAAAPAPRVRKRRAAEVVAAAVELAPAAIVAAAPVAEVIAIASARRLRRFWCACGCGRRAALPIGHPTPAGCSVAFARAA